MNPRLPFIFTVTIILSSSCGPADRESTSGESAPNIILIMADDMGYECVGAYGSIEYSTPHLDQMAEEGILVTHCIANPLCTPSRVKIMTGKYNFRNYEYFGYLNPQDRTFGHVLKEAGYKTCIVGKWQLNGIYHDLPGNQDLQRPYTLGFDEYCLWQLNRDKASGERYADPLIVQNGREIPRDADLYGPDLFADYALDFIERNRDSAFFLYYPMVLVHDPFVPTPDSEEWNDPGNRYKQDTALFGDMVTYADKIVGKINLRLKELGIRENTLLIFTGDNGTNRAIVSSTDHGNIKGAKGMTIDHGVHVPLIMQWPEKTGKHSRYDGILEFSDFFATFADLVNDTSFTDGQSFLELFEGGGFKREGFAFVHYDPMWGTFVNAQRNRFVQDAQYKLYQDGRMFHITEDVLEEQPLDPGQVDGLRTEMQMVLDRVPDWK